MITSHTPKSWKLDERYGVHAIVDSNGQDITYIDKAPVFYEGKPCGSVTSRGRTREELKELAHLLAAAPDLLEALVKLVNIVTHPQSTKENMRMIALEARDAIAKAQGGAA